jgi:hypothetical protein
MEDDCLDELCFMQSRPTHFVCCLRNAMVFILSIEITDG